MHQCFKCHEPKMRPQGRPGVFQCASCDAREAHGQPMPRIVVQPYEHDTRFAVVTWQDPIDHTQARQFVIDRGLAKMLGTALLSLLD